MLCTCDIYLVISAYTLPFPSCSSAGALALAFFTLWVSECTLWVLKKLCCTIIKEGEKPTTIVAHNKREFYVVRHIINKSMLGTPQWQHNFFSPITQQLITQFVFYTNSLQKPLDLEHSFHLITNFKKLKALWSTLMTMTKNVRPFFLFAKQSLEARVALSL